MRLPGLSLSVIATPRRRGSLEAGDPGAGRGEKGGGTGVGFNQRCQRTRIRCGFVSGHVYINQYFRHNLVNGFNSKRMLKPEKLSGARQSVIFREKKKKKDNIVKRVGTAEIF